MDDLQEVAVMLETGIKAPEFTLKNQDGEEVSLKDFLGKKVILPDAPHRPVLLEICTRR